MEDLLSAASDGEGSRPEKNHDALKHRHDVVADLDAVLMKEHNRQ